MNLTKKKLTEILAKEIKESGYNKESLMPENIVELSKKMDGITGFEFNEQTPDCDYWIEAQTGIYKKDDKGFKRYFGIIFDYDVQAYESVFDEVVDLFWEYHTGYFSHPACI